MAKNFRRDFWFREARICGSRSSEALDPIFDVGFAPPGSSPRVLGARKKAPGPIDEISKLDEEPITDHEVGGLSESESECERVLSESERERV